MPPPSFSELPLHPAADGIRLAVRLLPRANADRIDGVGHLADGSAVLKVAVTAPPADNRANEALLQLLARRCRVPRRALTLLGGATSRNKLIHIAGDPEALRRLLVALLAPPQE